MAPDTLRTLAATAIEAAVAAGATYADIRIGDRRAFGFYGALLGQLTFAYAYGLRVRVGGSDVFVSGTESTRDAVTQAAQQAVAKARLLAAIVPADQAFVHTQPVKGEWHAPCAIDPFTVSVDEHCFLMGRFYEDPRHRTTHPGGYFAWDAETRVFASSDGSRTTQYLRGARTKMWVSDYDWHGELWRVPITIDGIQIAVPAIVPQTAGIECITGADLNARVDEAATLVTEWRRYPLGQLDVGRYPVVFDGETYATILGRTLIPALSLSRVLGEERSIGLGSFLTVEDWGQTRFAPAVSLSVGQRAPYFGAAQWDDEGIATTDFPLIERGRVVNYLATRTTAALASAMGHASPVHGVARTPDASGRISALPGTFIVPTEPNDPSLDELFSKMGHGIFAMGIREITVDPEGTGGTILPSTLFEIRNGAIVRRIYGARLEYSTKRLLAGITATGHASTVGTALNRVSDGFPWMLKEQAVHAPAVLCKEIDVAANSVA